MLPTCPPHCKKSRDFTGRQECHLIGPYLSLIDTFKKPVSPLLRPTSTTCSLYHNTLCCSWSSVVTSHLSSLIPYQQLIIQILKKNIGWSYESRRVLGNFIVRPRPTQRIQSTIDPSPRSHYLLVPFDLLSAVRSENDGTC